MFAAMPVEKYCAAVVAEVNHPRNFASANNKFVCAAVTKNIGAVVFAILLLSAWL
jgi:hypothetical protein